MSRGHGAPAAAVCLWLCALSLVSCGGATNATRRGTLPVRARVVYASDRPLNLSLVHSVATNGRLLASLGFDPLRDGFSFQNYGFVAGGELDAHAMRELFGDQVCADAPSDSCTMTPQAQMWSQSTDDEMIGGHCFGFAVTSLRFFSHNLNPSGFGAATAYALPFSPALQSEIAYGWATQTLPPVENAVRPFTPGGMVSFLERALVSRRQFYTLDIWNGQNGAGSEGHAVVPIGVQALGHGQFDILIYDNNKPGSTQAISVNEHSGSWSYLVGINPNVPADIWTGQGRTNEMALVPLSAALAHQPCPFCARPGLAGTDTISLAGDPDVHGHLLITTTDGRHLGYLHGRFVDQIPAARIIRPELNQLFTARAEPIYELPARLGFTVRLDGNGADGIQAAAVDVTGPGFGAALAQLRPRAGSSDQLTIAPDGASVRTVSHGDASGSRPTLELARGRGRSGNQLSATTPTLGAGASLMATLDPRSGRARLSTSGANGSTQLAQVTITRVDAGGRHTRTERVLVSPQRATTA